jgi:hypothetical protein
MTTVEQRIAGPERSGGQGLDHHQEESGNRAIVALLTDPVRGEQVDLVMTFRREADASVDPLRPSIPQDERGEGSDSGGSYEIWAKRGMVRFVRRVGMVTG